jgi:hypothetical protein
MATLIIAGQIKLLNADTPIQNLKVELWDSVSGGYGLLGSACLIWLIAMWRRKP